MMKFQVKTMKMHHGGKGTCTAAFQENPCARMKNTYFCKDLRAPLSSPLFKRILQREYEKCPRPMVAKDPCHRHFYRDSLCENQKSKNSKQKNTQRSKPATGNHDNKKPGLRGQCFSSVHSLRPNCRVGPNVLAPKCTSFRFL